VRIFIDVGAHYGETLEVALDPAWGFDRVFLLEPASVCHSLLRKFRDRRISVHPVALGATNGTATLYGAGLLGGSLFREKRQKARAQEIKTEQIQVVRASEWFETNIPDDAEVFMKFNCEGAECAIIDELLSAGLGPRLTSLYVDFDVRKIDALSHQQAEIERRLDHAEVRFVTSDTLGCVANPAVVRWLKEDCPGSRVRWMDAIRFRLGLYAPSYVQLKFAARRVLPPGLYNWIGHRFGRLARAAQH
jgi:FkbM family methyltransferase